MLLLQALDVVLSLVQKTDVLVFDRQRRHACPRALLLNQDRPVDRVQSLIGPSLSIFGALGLQLTLELVQRLLVQVEVGLLESDVARVEKRVVGEGLELSEIQLPFLGILTLWFDAQSLPRSLISFGVVDLLLLQLLDRGLLLGPEGRVGVVGKLDRIFVADMLTDEECGLLIYPHLCFIRALSRLHRLRNFI